MSYHTISYTTTLPSLFPAHPLPIRPKNPTILHSPPYLNFGSTGRRPTASATHPPIKHNPPIGVTGPRTLNRCGSSVSRYSEPENMVVPAVKSDMAIVFWGATTAAKVSTAEWMSCSVLVLRGGKGGVYMYLVLGCGGPVCEAGWVGDAFL